MNSPDPALIAEFGEDVIHIGYGAPQTVKVIRSDPSEFEEASPGVAVALFGTMADSGFTTMPVKNDLFEVQDIQYRVVDVKLDVAGGIHILLTL